MKRTTVLWLAVSSKSLIVFTLNPYLTAAVGPAESPVRFGRSLRRGAVVGAGGGLGD